jgi:perosamine synthetase
MKIPLIKPYIDQNIKDKVIEVLDSGYLTEGPVTKEFENKFTDYIGCGYAIAVTSATTGLEVALRALGIGEGDEVIVPDYTYPATASVVPIVGAKVVIVDVDKESMLIDYNEIEKAITPNTKAIIPVSLFGNPLDYVKLNKIKDKHNLYIVEDAACSIGAEYNGIKVGNQADISVFSLHPRKFITTGEGGIITTDNSKWAEWMNSYKHFGMNMSGNSREKIQFNIIGTNYKLSNVLSAIGLGQMTKIEDLLSKRIELANNYIKLISKIDGIELPSTLINGKHSYQSFCIFVNNRDEIMKKMRDKGIEVQIGNYTLHLQNAFKNNELVNLIFPFNGSQYAFEHCLTLPLYHELTKEQQEYIVKQLLELL